MTPREQRRVSKVDTGKLLRVVVCSIGSDIKYELTTHNLSSQGIFLRFDDPRRFPFTSSSILEITLYLTEEEPIFFNGKVSQIVYTEDKSAGEEEETGIGIRIVQISSKDQELYNHYISEEQAGSEIQEAS